MPVHVSGPFVAHHQEVASVCVAKYICLSSKWSVSLPTDHLEDKKLPFATHTLVGRVVQSV
jgi:hypothetical protein